MSLLKRVTNILTLKIEYIIHNFSTQWDQSSLKMTTTISPLKYTICLTVVLFCRWIQICNRSDNMDLLLQRLIDFVTDFKHRIYTERYKDRDDVTISQFSCYCIFINFVLYLNLINHTCKYLKTKWHFSSVQCFIKIIIFRLSNKHVLSFKTSFL